MANYWHVEWLKEGVSRWNKRRKRVDFAPDLSGIRFFEHLPKDYRDDPKTSRYFEKIDLSNSNLDQSDLSDLNFSNADFSGSSLVHSDLSKSNFSHAKFVSSDLRGANGTRAVFDYALFEGSEIGYLNLTSAEVEGAIFIGTSISDDQIDAIGNQSVKVYQSRAEFKRVEITRMALEHKAIAQSKSDEADEERKRKSSYDVYFGTNRSPRVERGAVVGFTGKKVDDISYGLCEVIVPEGHRIGKIGTPIFRRLFNKKDDALKITSLIPLDRSLFWLHLLRTSEKMKQKARPTVFIHGFNTSFDEAVIRAAQIGHDLGIGQGIGLFSWPSKGNLLAYSADEASAEASKYDLANFLESFVERGTELGLNVIAHSMGCRVLLGALEELQNRRSKALHEISQVIIAAADVDANIMPHLGKSAITHSERLTSYVSGADTALRVSGWLHSYPRVGRTPPTFVMNGMDTVVVNDMNLGDFSHGYLGSSRAILGDVFSLLKSELPPDSRYSVESVEENGLRFWRIKN